MRVRCPEVRHANHITDDRVGLDKAQQQRFADGKTLLSEVEQKVLGEDVHEVRCPRVDVVVRRRAKLIQKVNEHLRQLFMAAFTVSYRAFTRRQ